MPVDIKEIIARSAIDLLTKKQVKKLTVKDIVEECGITRQTFYYHFEDIPDLIRWMLDRGSREIIQNFLAQEDLEGGIRYLLTVALNARPMLARSMQTNYRDELETLLSEHFFRFFEQLAAARPAPVSRTYSQQRLLTRYHSQAFMGLIRTWTKEDTDHMDEIVHDLALLVTSRL